MDIYRKRTLPELLTFTEYMDISLNKYISETGFCSRREADKYIEQCRVSINGKDASKGARVKEGDVVLVDGERIKKKQTAVYIALNKPKGITCTTDLKDKSNIIDFVNFKTRIFPIGRLDKRSEGLIFLTNDGDIVNKILRAGNQHEKEYIVSVDKPITLDFIQKMRNGVRILGTVTKKCFVQQEGPNRFKIILVQGLNRQIRRMCEALGYNVESLKRTRIMNITLGRLAPGKWRYFTIAEIDLINKMVANSSKTNAENEGMDE
jgi:23S rRNA pseudouridine2604 synthase